MVSMSWNRYSVMVARGGEVPRVWRSRDVSGNYQTAAWLLGTARKKAGELRRRGTYDHVEVVPARDEDVAPWQKTEFANRANPKNSFAVAAE